MAGEANVAEPSAAAASGGGQKAGRRRVVIVGGGFGGLAAARELRGADVEVTVVDRIHHHLFQPLLYQVACGGLSAGEIASPIRTALRWPPQRDGADGERHRPRRRAPPAGARRRRAAWITTA